MTGSEDIALRPARDADGAAIATMIERVFAEYEGCLFIPAEFPELAAPASHYQSKGGVLWVAEREGNIVGSIAIFANKAPDIYEIGKLYVAVELRGSGLAARLLTLVADAARQRGARQIILFSDTRFTRGHAFYEKHGFLRLPGVRLLHDISRSLEFPFRRLLGDGAAA